MKIPIRNMRKGSVVLSIGHEGLRGFIVSIETIVRRGIFQFDIVGLANKTVSESKQRILSAIQSCEIESPRYSNKKIITLLSPADDKKEGSHFDLPIAISYLIAGEHIKLDLSSMAFIGELTLRGQIRPVKNTRLLVSIALAQGITHIVVPSGDTSAFSAFKNIYFLEVSELSTLIQLIQSTSSVEAFYAHFSDVSHFKNSGDEGGTTTGEGGGSTDNYRSGIRYGLIPENKKVYLIDSIKNVNIAKRALLIGLAGKHHMVFIGQPGTGKSLLAKSAQELISAATDSRVDEVTFREPHHTSSYASILGSKSNVGELISAHGGILFFDELIEFDRRVLESMRQPLEDKYVQHPTLGKVSSDFIFIGTMNPCGCGYFYSKTRKCVCNRNQIERYQRKIQSPLFERMDITVNFYKQKYTDNSHNNNQTEQNQNNVQNNQTKKVAEKLSGEYIRNTVGRVRKIQKNRLDQVASKIHGHKTTQEITRATEQETTQNTKQQLLHLKEQVHERLSSEVKRILSDYIDKNGCSKREEGSLILVAQTIADIEESDDIKVEHVLEAFSYRRN